MRLVDAHVHALPPAYVTGLLELGLNTEATDGFPEPAWSEEDHLAFAHGAGDAYQILSISSPHPHAGDADQAACIASGINDELASLCRRYPKTFGFAAVLPLPSVPQTLEELNRAYDELGALGVKVPSNALGTYLGDPEFDSVLEALERRRAVVTIHPCAPQAVPEGCFTAGPKPLFEFLTDTTRLVLNLVMHAVPSRYPHVSWVVPHAGSFVPEVIHRLEGITQILAPQGKIPRVNVFDEVGRLYFDLAGDVRPVMLEALLKIARPDHLLYGSDYPYTPAPIALRKRDALFSDPLLAGHVEDVAWRNATRLYL